MHQRPKHPGPAFQPLLFAPPQGSDALPKTIPPPALAGIPSASCAQNDNAALAVSFQDGDDTARLTSNPSGFYQAAAGDPRRTAAMRAPLEPTPEEAPMGGPPPKTSAVPMTLRGHIDWLDAEAVLDELDEDQLALSMRIAGLERAGVIGSKDEATRNALRPLHDRLGDLIDVCDALAALQRSAIAQSVHRAFLPDAPLAEYVRGVYAWMHAVVRALEELVFGVRRGERKTKPMDLFAPDEPNEPDWATYRWRIEEAKNFHFHELERAIRIDLAQLLEDLDDDHNVDLTRQPSPNPIDSLIAAFDDVLGKARALEKQLDLD
jgi:hypothetical protein